MDVVQSALIHAPNHDVVSFAWAAVAGLITSIGPCVAPRYLAAAGMFAASDSPLARLRLLTAFVVGTLSAYFAIATAGSLLFRLVSASPYVYFLTAAILAVFGVRTILRDDHDDDCRTRRATPGLGGAFLLGMLSSAAISPCCTPVLVAFGAMSGLVTTPLGLSGLVAAFTAGHLAPLAFACAGANTFNRIVGRYRIAASTVTGAIMMAVALYYAVLG